jgi:transcriptional regulator with GAF, ATPase, and Fis domain
MLPSAKKRRENGAELASDFRRPDQRLPDASVHGVPTEILGADVFQIDSKLAAIRATRSNRNAPTSAPGAIREFDVVISKNARMVAIFDLLALVARSTSTVLIEGETGTGKEIVARALHEASTQRRGPMVAVNCAALSEQLLESELFGHEKGSFTSAAGQRKGRFELAHRGTLFLDEVGDMPVAMQCKLLRVLQERSFERVGGTRAVAVDVRVVAATNRSLKELVHTGKFREDLYYRLDVIKINLPPLRERPEDIPLLALHFAEKFAFPGEAPKGIPPRVLELLQSHCWPGNVRELENAIERACATTRGNMIRQEDLPQELIKSTTQTRPKTLNPEKSLPDMLREAATVIDEHLSCGALDEKRCRPSRISKLRGLRPQNIRAKLIEYGIGAVKTEDA